jgi:hypothetical protein
VPHVGGEIYKAVPFSNDFESIMDFLEAHREHGVVVQAAE